MVVQYWYSKKYTFLGSHYYYSSVRYGLLNVVLYPYEDINVVLENFDLIKLAFYQEHNILPKITRHETILFYNISYD